MLLTLTASSAPNFILIGPGLVWQTLPAGWVDTVESHYITYIHVITSDPTSYAQPQTKGWDEAGVLR